MNEEPGKVMAWHKTKCCFTCNFVRLRGEQLMCPAYNQTPYPFWVAVNPRDVCEIFSPNERVYINASEQ